MTRLVAGAARGRRLSVPGRGTRPTSDRAREGLFSSLVSLRGDLDDARVLDLFAGSGAVGLEALSRGAQVAVLVEDDPLAVRVLRENAAAVGLPGSTVVATNALRFAERYAERYAAAPFDVVFADPPYSLEHRKLSALLSGLADAGLLAPGAVVAVERSSRDPAHTWPAGFPALRERRYGEGTLWYARWDPSPG